MKNKRPLLYLWGQTDNFISVKEYEKICKYKDSEIEIEKIWHPKTMKS